MGNSTSALPYLIENETHSSTGAGTYGWSMHNGKRKSDGMPVTVFKAEKKALMKKSLSSSGLVDPTMTQILPALFHFHKIKTILHPNILRVYATLDTDFPNGETPEASNQITSAMSNPSSLAAMERFPATGDLIIVTEPVTPLAHYLNAIQALDTQNNSDAIAWGILCLIQALDFLHSTAKLAHGNVCPYSVFVTPAGDFKLGNFALLTPVGDEGPTRYFKHFEKDITPREYRSPERIDGRWEAITKSPIHSMDSYSLGVFIEEVYRHPGAGTHGKVPDKLIKAVQRLKIQSLSARPKVAPLSQCPLFDNALIKTHLFLDSIAAKPIEEKIVFLQSLPDLLARGTLPKGVAVHKVLPILIRIVTTIAGTEGAMTQEINRRECLAVVTPLLCIADNFLATDRDNFTTQLKPVVELLFRVNDRGVRGALLTKVNLFVKHFDPTTLNNAVFDPLCSGFTDSSAPLRELTLKSSLLLVPVLTPVSIEKLGRYLVRLQSDSEASIRTNTIIFIGKIAGNLSEQSRNKLLLPAFTRAMKDSFNPCRLAACKTVWTCRDYFAPKVMAENVLPALFPHLVDPVEEIRNEAFRVVEGFIELVRKESERMTQEALAVSPVSGPNGGVLDKTPVTTIEQSSGSYLSGWSSWGSTKIESTTGPTNTISGSRSDNSLTKDLIAPSMSLQASMNTLTVDPGKHFDGLDGDDDGWSDEDESNIYNDDARGHSSPSSRSLEQVSSDNRSGFKIPSGAKPLGTDKRPPPHQTSVTSTMNSTGWSDDDDHLFDSISQTKGVNSKNIGSFNSTLITERGTDSLGFQSNIKATRSSGGKLLVPAKGKVPGKSALVPTEANKDKPKMVATKIKASDDDVKDGWDDF
jgi:SCY1-like protein 1